MFWFWRVCFQSWERQGREGEGAEILQCIVSARTQVEIRGLGPHGTEKDFSPGHEGKGMMFECCWEYRLKKTMPIEAPWSPLLAPTEEATFYQSHFTTPHMQPPIPCPDHGNRGQMRGTIALLRAWVVSTSILAVWRFITGVSMPKLRAIWESMMNNKTTSINW